MYANEGHAGRPLTQSLPAIAATQESLLLANIVGHNILHAATVVLAVSQEVQSRPSALLLRSLDNLHAVHVGTEDLDGHLNSDTSKLVSQKE